MESKNDFHSLNSKHIFDQLDATNFNQWQNLRAAACNFQELPDKIDISDFSIFCQEKPFGKLLTKIPIKVSKEFLCLRNTEKCEMPCSCRRRH